VTGRIASFLAALAMTFVACAAAEAKPPALKCEVGPVKKTYGSTPWLVYGCDDGKSLIVVTAEGSAAMPFVFIFTSVDGSLRLSGEGNGDKSLTDAAFAELSKLNAGDIENLIRETKVAGRSN
jgi:hypothetical protein